MEEIARVYADALFEAGKESDKLDVLQEQLAQFADALDESRDMQVFFFSPYFPSAEKTEGISKAVSRRRARVRQLPRAPGREAPDAGALPDPARGSTSSWPRRTRSSR